MKLGYPNHPRIDVVQEIEWAARSGFDFIDLFLEPDMAALDRIDRKAIRSALDRHGLDVVGHLAYYLPTGSALPQMRRAAVDTAVEYLGAFCDMRVPAVSIHANWPPGLFTVDEGIAWQLESLGSIISRAAELGVRLMYEPVTGEADGADNIERIMAALPDLLLHLDLGHCNLHGRRPEQMIRRLRDRLHHVHLHDNDGLRDLHLPPGTGTIDWPAVFEALGEIGYNRTITLEVFSRDRDFQLLALEKVRAMCRPVDG